MEQYLEDVIKIARTATREAERETTTPDDRQSAVMQLRGRGSRKKSD